MKFTNTLIKGKLIKRYKRFFVDIEVNNKIVTAHCPNTGSMMGLLEKNNEAWLSHHNNPKRKLKYTLEMIKVNKKKIGVNTHRANRIVEHALKNKLIDEFKSIKNLKAEFTDHEYKYGTVGMARSMNQFYRIVRYGVVQIPAGWVPRIFKMELIISCCSNPVPFR